MIQKGTDSWRQAWGGAAGPFVYTFSAFLWLPRLLKRVC